MGQSSRAQMGHPEPFGHMDVLAVGNEQWETRISGSELHVMSVFEAGYYMQVYPDMRLLGTAGTVPGVLR